MKDTTSACCGKGRDQTSARVDLLLTDIVMPGPSGQELAFRLRQCRPQLRVLYTSRYTADVVAPRENQVNEPAFIPKPYSPELLVRRVRSVLSRS